MKGGPWCFFQRQTVCFSLWSQQDSILVNIPSFSLLKRQLRWVVGFPMSVFGEKSSNHRKSTTQKKAPTQRYSSEACWISFPTLPISSLLLQDAQSGQELEQGFSKREEVPRGEQWASSSETKGH